MPVTRRTLLSVFVVGAGTIPALVSRPAAAAELQLRGFPIRWDGDRAVVWLEVTGSGAARVDSGADKARLILGDRRYRPIRALVRREESPEPTTDLDGTRVERVAGATYLRFEFTDLPKRFSGRPHFLWVWHTRERGDGVRWEHLQIARRLGPLEMKTGGGFRVALPEGGWQDTGTIHTSRAALEASADRNAWFHFVVRPGPSEGVRFPAGYVGYDLEFRRTNGETVPARTVRSTGAIGGDEDREEILALFPIGPDAAGTLTWTPLISYNRGREYRIALPEGP